MLALCLHVDSLEFHMRCSFLWQHTDFPNVKHHPPKDVTLPASLQSLYKK